jgi:hypothetical protein
MKLSLFTPRACALASTQAGTQACRAIRPRHVMPLVGFLVPTVVIGFGVVIPRSCIAGVNSLTIGFATTIIGACATYLLGVRAALRR